MVFATRNLRQKFLTGKNRFVELKKMFQIDDLLGLLLFLYVFLREVFVGCSFC